MLAIIIWKLATPNSLWYLASQLDKGKSTVREVVTEVSLVIQRVLALSFTCLSN